MIRSFAHLLKTVRSSGSTIAIPPIINPVSQKFANDDSLGIVVTPNSNVNTVPKSKLKI